MYNTIFSDGEKMTWKKNDEMLGKEQCMNIWQVWIYEIFISSDI